MFFVNGSQMQSLCLIGLDDLLTLVNQPLLDLRRIERRPYHFGSFVIRCRAANETQFNQLTHGPTLSAL
jgi:hypothetical protein